MKGAGNVSENCLGTSACTLDLAIVPTAPHEMSIKRRKETAGHVSCHALSFCLSACV
jgi:hypothetical protein